MRLFIYLCSYKIAVNVKYLLLHLTNKIPLKQIYFAIFQANIILSFLSNSFYAKISVAKYFFNLNFNRQFLYKFFFSEKRLVLLANWIYPTFYKLDLIDKSLEKNKGLIILNLHSFNHFALQLLLQKKYSNIYTIIMDENVDIYLNFTKANINNHFLYYKDHNLFFQLRKVLMNNNIIIIHQDLFYKGHRYIEVNFMKKKVSLLENIAAYLSFYTSCPVISSYTYSFCGILTKTKFIPFMENSQNNIDFEKYKHIFHQNAANYIAAFVRKYPSQWMGWKYLKHPNFKIEDTKKEFFPDYIFFDKQQKYFVLCKIFPLHLIKIKPSRMHINLIKYFYKLMMNGIKNYCKKS
jgi:lauroyl/myristoyl acyltransferase